MATTNRQYDDAKIVASVSDLDDSLVVDHVLDDVQVNFDPPAQDGTAVARITIKQTWTVPADLANTILNEAT